MHFKYAVSTNHDPEPIAGFNNYALALLFAHEQLNLREAVVVSWITHDGELIRTLRPGESRHGDRR